MPLVMSSNPYRYVSVIGSYTYPTIAHLIPHEAQMKLYEATNGYMGESYVRCLVIAPDDETAMRLARKRYSEHIRASFDDEYIKIITLEILCNDTSKEWSNAVTDG